MSLVTSTASFALWLIVKGLDARSPEPSSCICGSPVAEEYDIGEPAVCEYHRVNGGGPLHVVPEGAP